MPAELRHILFRTTEVVSAVVLYQRHMGLPLPAGTILSCGLEPAEPGAAIGFSLVIGLDKPKLDEAPRRRVTVEGPALAAALILLCRERHVPLPAKADKSLQRFGDQLGLVVAIGSNDEEAALSRTDVVNSLRGVNSR